MMKLIVKNQKLFAVDQNNKFIGKVVNQMSGECVENPENEDSTIFDRIFEGHGYIYHQDNDPPNPFFIKDWSSVFENSELLPKNTKNVFVDQGDLALNDFNAVLLN